MQTVDQLLAEVDSALSRYGYYRKCDILSQGKHPIKLTLYLRRIKGLRLNSAILPALELIRKGFIPGVGWVESAKPNAQMII